MTWASGSTPSTPGSHIATDLVGSGTGAGVCGLYLTMPLGEPPEGTSDPEAGLTGTERQGLRDWAAHQAAGTVIHLPLNTTRPHTMAFAINDSPAGLAAWQVDCGAPSVPGQPAGRVPPSTPSTWPLTYDASSDARNRITAAISAGCAGLPAAMPATIRSWRSAGIRPVSSSVPAV
jgi:hypothetical protein